MPNFNPRSAKTWCFALCAAGAFLSAAPALAAGYSVTPVMNDLVAPRKLAFGPDGALYVTEAGNGGTGASVVLGDGRTATFGTSGGLSRYAGGVQTRVLSDLPSVAVQGADASGLNDISFDASGHAYGLFGLGAMPLLRDANLGADGADLGTITTLSLDGSSTTRTRIADVSAHASTFSATADSNPFAMVLHSDGSFSIADAGLNSFLQAAADGSVSTLHTLPPTPNPLPFGPPVYQAVPTAVAIGANGHDYFGQLTGFPFPAGAANVYDYDPTIGSTSVALTGFTNIIDLKFDSAGNLYVLQLTTNGIVAPEPGDGLLVKIDALTQQRTIIASDGLVEPGGLAIGPDGAFYVSTHTDGVGAGQVLRIAAVPEPAGWALMLSGLTVLGGLGARRQRQLTA